MSDLDPSQFLSPDVCRQLRAYQQRKGISSVAEALNHLLENHFALGGESSMQQQIEGLEGRVYTLTREVMLLRQSVPDQCDRLREQLAAVRLSHSGLLQNLRQRLETLEQAAGVETSEMHQEVEPDSERNLS